MKGAEGLDWHAGGLGAGDFVQEAQASRPW